MGESESGWATLEAGGIWPGVQVDIQNWADGVRMCTAEAGWGMDVWRLHV